MIALYERVSTDEQAQHGFSLDAQKERLEAYCKSQGWVEFEHFIDDGYTGKNMDRPALQGLIRYVEQKQIDAVIVYKLDRLGRRQKDVLYLLEDVFDKHGVSFKSATEPFDTSTPLGRAMLGILAVFGQLERDTIVERTKFGLRQRARRGLWPSASVPFGYRLRDGILHVEPNEAQIVRQVFERFIRGESRNAIAEWMQKRVPNRYVDHFIILKMIKRRTYLGEIPMQEDVFDGQHEAIIDEETFQAAQKELQHRSGGKKPRNTYLLSGMLTCGQCAGSVYYFRQKQKHSSGKIYYYHRIQCKSKKDSQCDTHSFLAREIEEKVIGAIRTVSVESEVFTSFDESSFDDQIIAKLETALKENKEQQERLVDAVQSGTLPIHMVKERLDKLEEERRAINMQLDDKYASMTPFADSAQFRETAESIQSVWDDMTFDEQREAIRLLIKNIRVYADKRVEIEWNL
ncbi:recombinase family protein [Alicyclobacillus fodiniaquatilis]|uniref:Recombinase family protein n=1 Tax=Alicyclobacillus fodiniaquatilis TaxID=1661150 RepID=A0ABW4JS48_9BACL